MIAITLDIYFPNCLYPSGGGGGGSFHISLSAFPMLLLAETLTSLIASVCSSSTSFVNGVPLHTPLSMCNSILMSLQFFNNKCEIAKLIKCT